MTMVTTVGARHRYARLLDTTATGRILVDGASDDGTVWITLDCPPRGRFGRGMSESTACAEGESPENRPVSAQIRVISNRFGRHGMAGMVASPPRAGSASVRLDRIAWSSEESNELPAADAERSLTRLPGVPA